MKLTIFIILISLSFTLYADNFSEEDVYNLYRQAIKNGEVSKLEAERIIYAAKNPYSPTESHTGAKFLEALSWYHDITIGNKDGYFTLKELSLAFDQQLEKYLQALLRNLSASDRISNWKMLQKLKILEKVILQSNQSSYAYKAKNLSQVSYENEWNRKNTIFSSKDFNKRVLDESWNKPVLVKFGLTYCIHCLLMENLGSVAAVAQKYKNKLMVYKLWWNPNEPQQFYELNTIASEQGITSSPIFNLYKNGRLIKSEYAFPDEDGSGLEEFLDGHL